MLLSVWLNVTVWSNGKEESHVVYIHRFPYHYGLFCVHSLFDSIIVLESFHITEKNRKNLEVDHTDYILNIFLYYESLHLQRESRKTEEFIHCWYLKGFFLVWICWRISSEVWKTINSKLISQSERVFKVRTTTPSNYSGRHYFFLYQLYIHYLFSECHLIYHKNKEQIEGFHVTFTHWTFFPHRDMVQFRVFSTETFLILINCPNY